jgi:predicted DNA-binding protein with PD1-like motif
MIDIKINKDSYILRVEANEELFKSLLDFLQKRKIKSAFFYGFGACKNCTIGRYNEKTKNYDWQKINQQMEICSLTGDFTFKSKEPYLHIHCTLANKKFQLTGGHLKELIVFPTCEILLITFTKKINRFYDNLTNLFLIND